MRGEACKEGVEESITMMVVDFDTKHRAVQKIVGDPLCESKSNRVEVPSALGGTDVCHHSDENLQKRLNEALDENKKNEATIARLRELILRHQEQERSMEKKIIQLSIDLAIAKAEVDLQQLKSSQLEQQPQESAPHRANKDATKEANLIASTYVPSRKKKTHSRSRCQSLNLPSNVALKMDGADDETASKDSGSNDKDNLFQSMGRRIGNNLDSSFRSFRRSRTHGQELTSSWKSEPPSPRGKIKPRSVSMNNFISTDAFDCDNNSAIDWPDS